MMEQANLMMVQTNLIYTPRELVIVENLCKCAIKGMSLMLYAIFGMSLIRLSDSAPFKLKNADYNAYVEKRAE